MHSAEKEHSAPLHTGVWTRQESWDIQPLQLTKTAWENTKTHKYSLWEQVFQEQNTFEMSHWKEEEEKGQACSFPGYPEYFNCHPTETIQNSTLGYSTTVTCTGLGFSVTFWFPTSNLFLLYTHPRFLLEEEKRNSTVFPPWGLFWNKPSITCCPLMRF